MLLVHQYALYLHIALGSCALIIFWIPVFTRKGNMDHKHFGRYFTGAMYAVAFSGITMTSLDLLFPLAMHAANASLTAAEAQSFSAEVRSLALFLLSLSMLVLSSTRQGWLSIQHKADRSKLRTPLHTILCASLVVIGSILFVSGVRNGSVLYMIFAVLQVASGVGSLRYNFKQQLKPKEWWIEHLRGLIESGIGAYTAFLVFGGRQLLNSIFGDSFSDIGIILWITPGVVGGIAIGYLSRHYENRFSG
jgi:uncharacterized membrane protein YidH (DUF202 family)